MHMPRRILLLLLLVILAVALPGRADEWSKKYSLSGKPEIRVDTNEGHVEVDTRDQKEIEARVETVGWRLSSSEVRILERQTGDSVELEVRVPHWHWNFGFGSHRSLKIHLTIPQEASLRVRAGDGHVTLQSMTGTTEIRTGDGHITLHGVKGEIRLTTGDGHIDADSLDGRLEATTRDGHIRAEGRFDLLNLHTGDGHMDIRALPGSKMAGTWTLRTNDGSVTLRLPDKFQADLDAHTRDGHISLDFPVTVEGSLEKSFVRGKMNGGGPTLTVRTTDGSIRLERL